VAHEAGWLAGEESFDFALAYSDHEHYARQVSHVRWSRTSQLLERGAPALEPADLMAILRDHYEDTFLQGPLFNPYLPDLLTLCMHDSPAGFTWGNTATSVVAALDPEQRGPPILWVAYGPPCSSLYLPIPFSAELPAPVTRTGREPLQVSPPAEVAADTFHPDSLWWRLHRLAGMAAQRPHRRLHIREHFDPIEREALGRQWSQEDDRWSEAGPDLLKETLEGALAALTALEADWAE
jgi:secernin